MVESIYLVLLTVQVKCLSVSSFHTINAINWTKWLPLNCILRDRVSHVQIFWLLQSAEKEAYLFIYFLCWMSHGK